MKNGTLIFYDFHRYYHLQSKYVHAAGDIFKHKGAEVAKNIPDLFVQSAMKV
jgi:hypothetical protein